MFFSQFCKPLMLFAFLLNSFFSFSQVLESSKLPIIKINGPVGSETKLNADINIISNTEGKLNGINDAPSFEGQIGIETRGASSLFLYPKKSYSFETRTGTGENMDTSLLSLPSENDWVLYGPYGDKSLIRDVLTYHLGNETGWYAPRSVYCELVLNGNYEGVYVLLERIKRDDNRVNIADLDEKDTEGLDLTGGYIVKIDRPESDYEGWEAAQSDAFYHYVYPEKSKITSEQKDYIKKHIQKFESAIANSSFSNPEKGFGKYMDLPSFVNYFIVSEVSKNIDAYRLSAYLYKEKDKEDEIGKIYAGPLWDYNLSFGNADYCNGHSPEGWAVHFSIFTCPEDALKVPSWWVKLKGDPSFVELLKERWTELRAGSFKTDNILKYVDSLALALDEPQKRNYEKWKILGTYVWPNPVWPNTYSEEISNLKNFIEARMEWLDKEIMLLTPFEETPSVNSLFSLYPNPFNKAITFKYAGLAKNSELKICNMLGQPIANLKLSAQDEKGTTWLWDGKVKGAEVPAGLYIGSVEVNGKLFKAKIYKEF